MHSDYDIIIIGSGPGGYGAAVKAVQKGAKVCLVEKNDLGGVCVNRGCIPTKTILNSALLYHKIKESENYGIKVKDPEINYCKIRTRALGVISEIKKSMELVLKSGKVDVIRGSAKLVSAGEVEADGKKISAKNIIVATGSRPKMLKGLPVGQDNILTSESFLNLDTLPKSVLIVGGGVIGCEWAGMLAMFGVEVRIVEMLDRLLPSEDEDLVRIAERNLKRLGVTIELGAKVQEVKEEKVMLCAGREPNSDGFEILEKSEGGWIKVDKKMCTSVPGVYAVGDVKGLPLLAYTAEREGSVAVSNVLGEMKEMDYSFIPRVTFSVPEIASVGARENERDNTAVTRGYFKGLGKAIADNETDGLVKIIYDKSDYKILGVGIVGKNASELIGEATLAVQLGLAVKEWAGVLHSHPVLSEIFSAALEKIK